MKPSELMSLRAQRELAVHVATRQAAEQRAIDLENRFIRKVQDELDLPIRDGWQYAVVGDRIELTHPNLEGTAELQPRGNHIMLTSAGSEIPLTNANITVLLECRKSVV